ncbi:MAG: hypothetical protein ABI778_01195 [Ignavibacteriota bacterium]
MRNIIFFIAIFFWILNLIAKNKKKQQQTLERKQLSDLNTRVKRRVETEPELRTQRQLSTAELRSRAAKRETPISTTDYELAYASNDYAVEPEKIESVPEEVIVFQEHDPVSHFKKNYGMGKSLGTESAEEKEAYDKDVAIIPRLSLTSGGIKQYIVAAEILGKPKALRR